RSGRGAPAEGGIGAGGSRGAPAVRSVAGSATAGRGAAAVRAGARSALDDAPHRLGRLVDGDSASRDQHSVRCILSRSGFTLAGAAGAVRGLCGVAEGLVGWRGSGGRAVVLAPAPFGSAGGAGSAAGP